MSDPAATVGMVSFWHTQIGPHYDGDPRAEGRCVGEVICPACNGIMARVHEDPSGLSISAWVAARGMSPGDPGSRRVGWTLWAPIDETTPADDDGSILNCWNDHGSMWITGADCRRLVTRYKARGKIRHPARQATEEELIRSE